MTSEDSVQPPLFAVESFDQDGVRVVVVSGEVDLASAPALVERLGLDADAPAVRTVVDLCEVTFVDSTGLSVLIRARRAVHAVDGAIAFVCRPDTKPARLFDVTGLRSALDVHADRPSALAAVTGSVAATRPVRSAEAIGERLQEMQTELDQRPPVSPPESP
jgi:anti-sigma B factor antagonist